MATDINSVVLIGRLTRDAELRYSNSGTAIGRISIACNYRTKKGDSWGEEVSYFDAVWFGRGAEAVHKYLVKGKRIGIQGELRQNRWEQDGQRRSKVEVVVNELNLLDGGQGGGGGGDYNRGAQSQSQAPDQGGGNDFGSGNDFEDDVPF